MRNGKKLFLVTLVLVLALTMALPIQAMASITCNGTVAYKVYSISNCSNVGTKTNSTTIVAKYKDYSSKVFEVETMLTKLGYNVGVVSKFFDYNTLLAVQKFQKANSLTVTGLVDQKTYAKIKALYNKLESDESNNPTTPTTPTVPDTKEPDTGSDTGSDTTDNVSGLTAQEKQMIDLVNKERTSRGLSALKVDMTLVKTARMKSNDMIAKNYFAHQSPTYGSPFDLMKSQGVTYRYAGENLAGAGSVESAHTNLMNSAGHRANILNVNYTHIGIGIVDGGRYGKMFTQHFIGK